MQSLHRAQTHWPSRTARVGLNRSQAIDHDVFSDYVIAATTKHDAARHGLQNIASYFRSACKVVQVDPITPLRLPEPM